MLMPARPRLRLRFSSFLAPNIWFGDAHLGTQCNVRIHLALGATSINFTNLNIQRGRQAALNSGGILFIDRLKTPDSRSYLNLTTLSRCSLKNNGSVG
jgi:hypothetical protein